MEAAPPSYEAATIISPVSLFGGYLATRDLKAACLVCRAWNQALSSHLWAIPSSHFKFEPLTGARHRPSFDDVLLSARASTRRLTHTFNTRTLAHESLYYRPKNSWLSIILERLPQLQSLLLEGCAQVDHQSLSAVIKSPAHMSFNLRLLDLSRCFNATSAGIVALLSRLNSLLFLDLTHTPAARDQRVFDQLHHIRDLKILRLEGIGLRDGDCKTLAQAVGTRLRSLDVRNNMLTDKAAAYLVETCFNDRHDSLSWQQDTQEQARQLGKDYLHIYQGPGFEQNLHRVLTTGFVSRLAFEDLPESGVTHLYVSGNQLSAQGVALLIQTGKLHVLESSWLVSGTSTIANALAGTDCGRSLISLTVPHRLVANTPVGGTVLAPKSAGGDTAVSLQQQRRLRWTKLDTSSYHPAMTPNLRQLTLVGFPPHSPDSSAIDQLTAFISLCAYEAHTVRREVELDYTLPPDQQKHRRSSLARGRAVASSPPAATAAEKTIFALERITIEITPVIKTEQRKSRQAHSNASDSTDEETHALWEAAKDDFSFFADEKIVPERKDPKRLMVDSDDSESSCEGIHKSWVDNVARLSEWRVRTREAARRTGAGESARNSTATDQDPQWAAQYWPGVVRVERG